MVARLMGEGNLMTENIPIFDHVSVNDIACIITYLW